MIQRIKIDFKKIVYIIILCFVFLYVIHNNYIKFEEKKRNKVLLTEKKTIEHKITTYNEENEILTIKIEDSLKKIEMLLYKFDQLIVNDENFIKKMIYVLANESRLNLIDISKSEIIWQNESYQLVYFHIVLSGDLVGFGEFLYYINKNKKYIDTTKTYIDLLPEEYKMSFGFIQKRKEGELEEVIFEEK